MKYKSNNYYDKKIDNELKKKEMAQKYGAHFSNNGKLPLEIESKWLDSIDNFEEQFSQSDRIRVFEYIGNPFYKPVTEIHAGEIPNELNRLMEIMNKNGVSVSTLCEVDDAELYRFITTELFEYEMDDVRMPGMKSCFIYEEFHPNDKYDIEQALDYFFNMSMGKVKNIGGTGYDLLYVDTENFVDDKGVTIKQERVEKNINDFLSSFDIFEIVKNEIKDITLNKEKTDARVDFYIEYQGLFEKSKEVVDFKGNACFKFHPSEYGGWTAYYIDLPGLNM